MSSWRAGCGESRTSGSEGGPRKRTGCKAGTAPRPDPYNQYTSGLRRDALARKAGGETPATRADRGARTPTRSRDRAATTAKAEASAPSGARSRPRGKRAVDPAKVAEAQAVIAATERLGGEAYTEAVGSDEVQAALEAVNGAEGVSEPAAKPLAEVATA